MEKNEKYDEKNPWHKSTMEGLKRMSEDYKKECEKYAEEYPEQWKVLTEIVKAKMLQGDEDHKNENS